MQGAEVQRYRGVEVQSFLFLADLADYADSQIVLRSSKKKSPRSAKSAGNSKIKIY